LAGHGQGLIKPRTSKPNAQHRALSEAFRPYNISWQLSLLEVRNSSFGTNPPLQAKARGGSSVLEEDVCLYTVPQVQNALRNSCSVEH